MDWLRTLATTVKNHNGKAILVLATSRGPNFDTTLGPRCWNYEECLESQMPMNKVKSDAFMLALGWEPFEGYNDLVDMYRTTKVGAGDAGFMGIFYVGNDVLVDMGDV